MSLALIVLPDAEKLDLLRRLDQFREWHSLDEKRYCLTCGNLITGWEIRVSAGSVETGPLQVICPTENCDSIPMDWVIPTKGILSALSRHNGDP